MQVMQGSGSATSSDRSQIAPRTPEPRGRIAQSSERSEIRDPTGLQPSADHRKLCTSLLCLGRHDSEHDIPAEQVAM